MLSSGLAFLWPAKKISQDTETKEFLKSLFEHADKLFETGHFEECYQLLEQCPVKSLIIY